MTFNKLKIFKGITSPNIPRLDINASNLDHQEPNPESQNHEEENVRQEEDDEEKSNLDKTRSASHSIDFDSQAHLSSLRFTENVKKQKLGSVADRK